MGNRIGPWIVVFFFVVVVVVGVSCNGRFVSCDGEATFLRGDEQCATR